MASSTSYTATGHLEVPQNFDTELGSANAPYVRELVPELGSRRQSLLTYDKMARTDVTSQTALKAAKVPILGADFYIDPEGEEQINLDCAEFVEYNLFEGMTSPWSFVLTRILKMYQHGFSILEPVYITGDWSPDRKMANTKKYTMLRKLAYRPALTIKDIEYDDNGGPVDIIQTAIGKDGKSKDVTIPIDKAIIFPFGDSDSLWGESIFRSSYANWWYKTHLYKVDAIQKERHGIGIPRGKLPPGYKPSDLAAMNELLSNLRTNERSFMTLPFGYEVDFAKVEGQLVDVLKSATHHDVMILMSVLAQFLMLGTGDQSGSRAVSSAQLDIFYKSEWFVAQFVCDMLNMYLIPKLVHYNFEIDVIPKMKVRNIGNSRDLQMIAAALANVANAEVITNDLETENWVRNLFDMPKKQGNRPTKPEPTKVTETITDNTATTTPTKTVSVNGGGKGTGTLPKSPTAP